jgi:HlyD family type I secretion membrane fusion protein
MILFQRSEQCDLNQSGSRNNYRCKFSPPRVTLPCEPIYMVAQPLLEPLRSIQSDEFLPPIHRWVSLGGLGLVATFAGVVGLAAATPYTVTVKTAGMVRPTGEVRLVQAAIGGTISDLPVKENQGVKRGDPIAIIESSQFRTKQKQLTGALQTHQRQLTQLTAQIAALDQQITAESGFMDRAITSAQADLSRFQRDHRDRQITAQTQVQEATAALELAQTEWDKYQQLANTGAIATLQVQEKAAAYKAATARLLRAQAALDPNIAPVTIAQSQIDQNHAKGESTLAILQKERAGLIQQQIQLQDQINRDRQDRQQLQHDFQQTVLKAPIDGTILQLQLRNPGQVVQPGATIAQIAPSHTALVIKARVSAQDIGKIKVCTAKQFSDCRVGQVEMRISAYPYPDYGMLKGVVRAISADVIPANATGATDSSKMPLKMPDYEVTIAPESIYLNSIQQKYPIQAGMEITAEILSKQETVLTFLLRKVRLLANG